MVMVLSFSLLGCGTKKEADSAENQTPTQEDAGQKETEKNTETEQEAETESQDSTSVSTVDTAFDSTGYEKLGNVYYKLSPELILSNDLNGTKVYTTADQKESIAFYVQNESNYTDEEMIGAYEQTIVKTYGENYTEETKTIGAYNWSVYSYTEDNLLNPAVRANIYLYSDGNTTIYLENAISSEMQDSGKAEELINSIVME